jgi:hypothetical protein
VIPAPAGGALVTVGVVLAAGLDVGTEGVGEVGVGELVGGELGGVVPPVTAVTTNVGGVAADSRLASLLLAVRAVVTAKL